MNIRLDAYLVEAHKAKSRERAKAMIKAGLVKVNDKVCTKPSYVIDEKCVVDAQDDELNYVGRGALKLAAAFEHFPLNVDNMVCADIGASTGGFTECLLKHGAEFVYAVDVGHGQLDKSLLSNQRIKNCEGINARNLTRDFFEKHIDFICADLSFISLTLVMPALAGCLNNGGYMVMLIKPQFEAGKKALNKKGIVTDRKDHEAVLNKLFSTFFGCGLDVVSIIPSTIKGSDGNIEYLAYLKCNTDAKPCTINVRKLVNEAFESFK